MKKFILDTSFYMLLWVEENIPERWRKPWGEIKTGHAHNILFEPLIIEIFYQLCKELGEKNTEEKLLWLKGLQNTKIVDVDDIIAFSAGKLYLKFRKYQISWIDSLLLTVARKEHAKIFTTDHIIRDLSKDVGIDVEYTPR